MLFFGLIWLGAILYLRLKNRQSFIYLTFFTIFFVYLFKVLDVTLFQFQSLLFLKLFVPKLLLNGVTAEKSFNLIPLITLTSKDLTTSLLNILMMIPFGFGLPFIANLKLKKIIIFGAFFSLGIELFQLISGILAKITFRIADINDVIFNTTGAAIGYLLFVAFGHYFSGKWQKSTNPVLNYMFKRVKFLKHAE